MTDAQTIAAMIQAYRTETSRTRANYAPKPWSSYADWVEYESFAAVLRAVRAADQTAS